MPIIQPSEKKDRRSVPRGLRQAAQVRDLLAQRGHLLRAVCVRCAILPNSVCIPVAKTTALACRPPATCREHDVPAGDRVVGCGWFGPRACGNDSPVTAALLTRAPNASITDSPRDVIARLQVDDVPGTSSSAAPARPCLAQYLSLLRQQSSQRRKRLLNPIFLPEGEQTLTRITPTTA